jgi:signal transduction histidine kinase
MTWESGLSEAAPIPVADRAASGGLRAALWVPITDDRGVWGGFEFFARRPREADPQLIDILATIAAQIRHHVERCRAEQEAERMKDEFFGLISHELRTPLTSIIGYTEALAETEGDSLSDRGRRFLEVVDRNARRELRLVGDLLALVRIEAGTFSIEPGSADLAEIVAEAVEAARPTAERQGVDLSVDADDLPEIEGDPYRLGQVVDNLLTNAIKFSPDGGSVDVRVDRRDGCAMIEVSDSGMGIPPEDRERLFERLFRAKGAAALQIPGTGLGLTIVKAIVDAHGGRIEVESDEGIGTTFRISLPMRLQDRQEREEMKEESV